MPTVPLAALTRPLLAGVALCSQLAQSFGRVGATGTEGKDLPHLLGFGWVHDQPSSFRRDIVAQHRSAADPLAFAACRRELIACPLPDDFALELRKREQDIQREPAHGGAGIEVLRYGNEAHATLVEQRQQSREV